MSPRPLEPDELEGFLDKRGTLIGFSAEDTLFRLDDGRILAVSVCVCGMHLSFLEVDEQDITKHDFGDA